MKKISHNILRQGWFAGHEFNFFRKYFKAKNFRNVFALIVFFLFATSGTQAQLTVNTSMSPQQLVQNVLLGVGVSINNVAYSGSSSSIGHFTGGGGTNLGLSSGVVMSTGVVDGSQGSPLLGSAVGNFASTDLHEPGDNDLLSLSGGDSCFDATILQFNFIPLSDTIKFRYVFASEEYPEYVCSKYNDVFGFFLSGPGIAGPYSNNSINIAKIPGTNLPVAINTVNNGNQGIYTENDCTTLSFSSDYVDNEAQGGTTVVFDGFTVVFTTWHVVQACKQYHIKLAIGDIGDGIFDSAVFLDAGSFSSTSVDVVSTTTNDVLATDTTAIKGCTDNILTFTRSGSSIANPLTVQINITGSAVNGVDYTLLPTSVTFGAGQSTTTLTVHPIWNGIPSGPKDVIVTIPGITPCVTFIPKVTIHLYDPNPIVVTLRSDTSIICPQPFIIPAIASGGNGTLNYSWNNGLGINPSITVTPFNTTTYAVTVGDACGLENAIDSVTISMPQYNPVRVIISPDTIICSGGTAVLSVSASGGIGDHYYLWSDSLGTNTTVSVSPLQATTYTVSVTDSCGLLTTVNVTVTVVGVVAQFTYNYASNDIINFVNQSVGGTNYVWDFGDNTTSNLENPTHTFADTGYFIVQLTATDAEGCVSVVQHGVLVYPPFHLYVPNAFTPDNDGLNDFFAPVAVGVIKSEMYIFNRWGNMFYHTTEDRPRWDGRDNKGEKAELGVYVYLLIFVTPEGKEHTSRGIVTLVR